MGVVSSDRAGHRTLSLESDAVAISGNAEYARL
jgi:hypothetical protein